MVAAAGVKFVSFTTIGLEVAAGRGYIALRADVQAALPYVRKAAMTIGAVLRYW